MLFVYTLLSVVLMFQSYWPITATIQCYKCSAILPPPYQNVPRRLCSEFDYSEQYIVDCPYSTFCTNKTYVVNLQTKIINGTVRDCAPQKSVVQEYQDGYWQKKIKIEEPYEEGCSEINDKGLRTSKTTSCYCNSSLCN